MVENNNQEMELDENHLIQIRKEKLKEFGICEGDTVKISDWELEWYE